VLVLSNRFLNPKRPEVGHARDRVSYDSLESPVVEILKVSSKSNPNSVAGALAGVVRGAGSVEMQVVGAGALNQAVKALAIARSYVANTGMDLACRPTFADITIDGEERTAIRLIVEKFASRATGEQADRVAADLTGGDPATGVQGAEPPPSVDARHTMVEASPPVPVSPVSTQA
jgi:stage V sporulation protein S